MFAAMQEQRYQGGCLCGGVRYEVGGAPRNLCYCHCTSCRRATGGVSVPWATFERAAFRVTRGALTEHRSSPEVARGFCAACGSSLTYRHARRPAEIDVTLVTLDAAARLAPEMHVWVADRLPWVHLDDGLPQHAAGSESGAPP